MSNRLIAILVAVGVALVVLVSSVFVVNEREQAIVTRLGEIARVHTEPGIYLKLPFIESLQRIEDRLLRLDLDNQRVQVSGGKFYEVDAFLTYRIEDPFQFRRFAQTLPRAETLLSGRFDAALRQTYGRRGFEAALSEERGEMMQEVAQQLRPAAGNLGISIEDVRIRRTDLTQEVSAQTYERMKAERDAEAARIRARGDEAARRINAAVDRQAVEIRAEAQREAEVLRGEGEGERNRIFAEAVSRDPEFYDFLRSLTLYRQSLRSDNTSMVLSPNSEFFRYEEFARRFGPSPAPSAAAAPTTQAPTEAPVTAPGPDAQGARGDDGAADDGTVIVPLQPAAPDTTAPANQ